MKPHGGILILVGVLYFLAAPSADRLREVLKKYNRLAEINSGREGGI